MDIFFIILELISRYYAPVLEIVILGVVFYYILNFLRGTRGASILTGMVIVLIAFTLLADLLSLDVLSWLLNGIWTFFAIALIVIFQPEFRRALAMIGSQSFGKKNKKDEIINELITAVINMADKHHGALLIIEQNIGLSGISDNPVILDAKLNHKLLESIFFPNSPLHDGAVIIKNGKIKAAGCVVPLSTNRELTKNLGTRHRAALGVTEETDALVVVISEETGGISIAYKGHLKRNIRPDRLKRFLAVLVTEDRHIVFTDLLEENIAK